jgi:hypothetical protein
MIIKNHYGQHGQRTYFLLIAFIAAAMVSVTVAFPNSPQVEAISTSTTCVDDQPCQTMVCGEDQPCKTVESPNTDFDTDENTVQQPLENTVQQPLESPGTIGQAPSLPPFNDDYWEDQRELLEERQEIMGDAEFE